MKIIDVKDAFVAKASNHPDNRNGQLPDESIRDSVLSESPHYAVVKFEAKDDFLGDMFQGSMDLVIKDTTRIQIEVRWPVSLKNIPGALLSTKITIDAETGNVEVVKQERAQCGVQTHRSTE